MAKAADKTTSKTKAVKVKKTVTKKAAKVADTAPVTAVEVAATVTPEVIAEEPLAKAGKRSPKALKEAEEKQAKEERKASGITDEVESKPKKEQKPARPRSERAGKKYKDVLKLIDKTKEYSLKEAIELAIKSSPTKFDATVELHVRLNVDPKVADQNIRDSLVLPAGTGKNVRVAVFGEADSVAEAKKAGADIAGSDEFLQQLDKGKIDFDILIATPTVMAKLGKYARVLGPKGLMPNPKSGTVTKNVTKAVKEAKGGRVEYRVDSTGIVHVAAGKVSFGTIKLEENLQALFASVKQARPASVKSGYVKSVFLTTAMGPSIKVNTSELN